MSKVNDGGPAFPSNRDIRYGGMTLRQYAAIKLRVPNSGTDWLDEMIRTSLRDDLAAKALPACYADYCKHAEDQGCVENWRMGVALDAYAMADAMLAAREGER